MTDSPRILTLGFTRKSAQQFFQLLKSSGAKRLIDVRLNNISQLAGFAKRDDLRYFAHEICDVDYVHCPELAPTSEMLTHFRKQGTSWSDYAARFLALLAQRRVEATLERSFVDEGCLLCSEHEPHHCHRRLVAEYLREKWGSGVTIRHLI